MQFIYSKSYIRDLLIRQLNSFYPVDDADVCLIDTHIDKAFAKCEKSFSSVKNKYYHDEGVTKFDPLHSCQWSFFLYALSRVIYCENRGVVCDKIYGLLRSMAAVDLFYQVELPDIFTFDHPLGAVMGRAHYANCFTFSQGCTVGNNHGAYPEFEESVFMLSNSKVIGASKIGHHVIIGANAFVKDEIIPSGSLVFGQTPNLVVKENKMDYVKDYAQQVFRYE